MLESVFDMQDEIKMILLQKNELHRISNINFNLLEQLLTFLKPFKECSEKLSSEKEPTMHIFALWSEKIKKVCDNAPFDSDVISEMKSLTLSSIKKRFQPNTLHLVGLFLNPPFKELNFLSVDKKEHIIETIKAMLHEIREVEGDANRDDSENRSPNAKHHEFSEFLDKNYSKKRKIEVSDGQAEMDKYLNMAVSENKDILEFWQNVSKLKLLRTLAKHVLCIPVSSATSERVFSSSGNILSERRTRLLSSNLDKLLFLY